MNIQAKDITIVVHEKPIEGISAIDNYFKDNWADSTEIDTISVDINRYAKSDRIVVWHDPSNSMLFFIETENREWLIKMLKTGLLSVLNN